ncbi:MAG: hypothetical protein EOM59_19190 [Clostridia bacterium]|nr:hypothetical protein [Clostridia bacterium]
MNQIMEDFLDFKKNLIAEIFQACASYNREVVASKGFGTWKPAAAATIRYKKAMGKMASSYEATGKLKKSFEDLGILTVSENSVACELQTYPDENWAFNKGTDVLGKLESKGRKMFFQEHLSRALDGVNVL